MDDNWRTAIGYICIASVLIVAYLGASWIMSPNEFTFKVEMDNNTKEAFEAINVSEINNLKCTEINNNTYSCPEGHDVYIFGQTMESWSGHDAKWWFNNGSGRELWDITLTDKFESITWTNYSQANYSSDALLCVERGEIIPGSVYDETTYYIINGSEVCFYNGFD